MKKIHGMIFFIGMLIIAAVFAYLYASGQGFAIVSSSQPTIGADGSPTWIINVAPERKGEQIVFQSDVSTLSPYVDTNTGIKTIPKNNFEIEFQPQNPTCTYQLTKDTGWFSWLSSVFGNTRYDIQVGAIRSSPVKVNLNQNYVTTIDAFDNTANTKLADGLYISSLGGFTGKKDCLSGQNNLFFVVNSNTKAIEFHTTDTSAVYSGFNSYYSYGCVPNAGMDKLVCSMSSVDLGLGVIQISASTKYTGFYYEYPTFGTPHINSLTTASNIESGKTNGVTVSIANTGTSDDKFGVKFYSDQASFQPTVATVSVAKGASQNVVSTMVGENVLQSTSGKICVDVYTISRYSDGVTDTQCQAITIKPTSIFTPNSCGNGVCDANENFATCAADCKQALVCQDKLEFINKQGQCECQDGYTAITNYYGDEVCQKDKDYSVLIYIGLGIIIVILLFAIFLKKRGKRK